MLSLVQSEEQEQREQLEILREVAAAATIAQKHHESNIRKVERAAADKHAEEVRKAKAAATASAEKRTKRVCESVAKRARETASKLFDAQLSKLQLQLREKESELTNAKAEFRKKNESRKSHIATLQQKLQRSEHAAEAADSKAKSELGILSLEYEKSRKAADSLQVHSNIVAQRLWNV